MAITNDIKQVIGNVGLQSLGIAAPLLSVNWTSNSGTAVTENAALMGLSATADSWVAPLAGTFSYQGGGEIIVFPDGSTPSNVSVLKVFPQVYTRLTRLYAAVIEGKTSQTHLSARPVPYYFVYSDTSQFGPDTPVSGRYFPGEALRLQGDLTIHDINGHPIDPIAVAAVFDALLDAHNVLEAKELLETTPTNTSDRQIHTIAGTGTDTLIVRAMDFAAEPYSGSLLTNTNALNASIGLFNVTDRSDPIGFSPGASDHLRMSVATHGRLSRTLAVPSIANGVSLTRDYFSIYVEDLSEMLAGSRPTDDDAHDLEARPMVRHNELISLSLNGNQTMGRINEFLSGSPAVALVVSPDIKSDYLLPVDGTFQNAQWPFFPPNNNPIVIDPPPIPAILRDGLAPQAHYIDGTDGDVVLVFSGLEPGMSVRVYERIFLPEAREGRGDGAGSIAQNTASGTQAAFYLIDPFRLRLSGSADPLPVSPTLHVDVVVVSRSGNKRFLGNINTVVAPEAVLSAQETTLIGSHTNVFDGISERAIASAGLLGLTDRGLPSGVLPGVYRATAVRDFVLRLGAAGPPREAFRLPSMLRRETIVASSQGGGWKASLSAAHLVKAAVNARPRIGSPGSPGGKEYDLISLETENGVLAYDLARTALRRTNEIGSRLNTLSDDQWNTPDARTTGDFSGVVLYNSAPIVETPQLMPNEFSLNASNMPASLSDLNDNLDTYLPTLPSNFKQALNDTLSSLEDAPSESRLLAEFIYAFSASVHGRRDTLWSLLHVIRRARKLIYIESNSLNGHENEVLDAIASQLSLKPGLKIIIVLPREIDYAPAYSPFKAWEYVKRKEALDPLLDLGEERVIVCHPMGIPGRPLRLMSQVVIIDDTWMLVGSSTFRRRGFTFDSSADMAFTGYAIQNGVNREIQHFRRQLMGRFIGAQAPLNKDELVSSNWIQLENAHNAFWLFARLLQSGGSGLITPLWDGNAPGAPSVAETEQPADNVANPEGRQFNDPASWNVLSAIVDYLSVGGLAP